MFDVIGIREIVNEDTHKCASFVNEDNKPLLLCRQYNVSSRLLNPPSIDWLNLCDGTIR